MLLLNISEAETGSQYKSLVNPEYWNDLIKFEGNAQGFRIITKLQNANMKGGLRLTCSTLGAFTKYPKGSFTLDDSKDGKGKFLKKFGFFQSEKELFKEIADETGLIRKDENLFWWARHPLTYLN